MEETCNIRINGAQRSVPRGTTVSSLLDTLGLAAQPVLVERNGAALFPRDFPSTVLTDGDALEIIRIVAGG